MEINWKISVDEAAYILNALATRPFKEVNALIGKLHKSTTEQINAGLSDGDSDKSQ